MGFGLKEKLRGSFFGAKKFLCRGGVVFGGGLLIGGEFLLGKIWAWGDQRLGKAVFGEVFLDWDGLALAEFEGDVYLFGEFGAGFLHFFVVGVGVPDDADGGDGF